MKKVQFDWTITFGAVIQIFIYSVMVIVLGVKLQYEVEQIKKNQLQQAATLQLLSEGQSDTRRQLEVLAAIVYERTGKPNK